MTWRSARLNLILLALTSVTVFLAGGLHEVVGPDGAARLAIQVGNGLRMVAGVFSIVLAHEMGHYLACRYYGVDATLPFLLPGPPILVGTFGAVIRIKSPFPHRRALFDIGIAGPLAGFAVCVPVLILGLLEAQVVPYEPRPGALYMGAPLLFRWAAEAIVGPLPDSQTLLVGPLGVAGWFGLLITALNMMPIGQLDGGHVTYALLGDRAQWVSRAAFLACLVLVLHRPTWLVWSVLMLVLLRRAHPPTLRDDLPLGRGRVIVGLLGFAVFAVCFTPSPIFITWRQLGEALLVALTGLPLTSR